MTRALLLALVCVSSAGARIKIDRYEAAPLPSVRLWVTLLDDRDRPVPPDRVESFSVYAGGRLLDDATFTTAAELGEPLAIALVLDARFEDGWRTGHKAIEAPLATLPGGTRAFAVVQHEDVERVPEAGWTDKPDGLAASVAEVRVGGEAPRLFRALTAALQAFPLREGVDREPDDVLPKLKKDQLPFPVDRVLLVVGDGHLETSASSGVHDRLGLLITLARRRGVRIMGVGLAEQSDHLWALEVLSRKTGGTYRRARTPNDVKVYVRDIFDEVHGRYGIDVDHKGLRRGDLASFLVKAQLRGGQPETSLEFTARIGNKLGLWARIVDTISDVWERWPWWARALVVGGVVLIIALIALVVAVRRLKKRRKAVGAAAAAQAAALAARRPCPVCGQVMMPDWPECLFCAQSKAAVQPMRFRLTGRSGVWAGQVHRFDKDLVTVGAAPSCDIQVLDRGVQAEHCGVRDRGDEFLLTDFATDAGTWLNGERITQTAVTEGDVIRVGECEFVFGVEA